MRKGEGFREGKEVGSRNNAKNMPLGGRITVEGGKLLLTDATGEPEAFRCVMGHRSQKSEIGKIAESF